MWTFLTVAMLCAFYIWRIEPLVKKQPRELPSDPMPPDLLAYAQGFDSEWARDQAVDKARELYGKLGNWEAVRTTLANSDRSLSIMEVVDN